MEPIIDPRQGDFEDDASSPERRSLISLAGSLLAEISLPKLALAWFLMLVLPSLLLGLAPIAVSVWFSAVKWKLSYALVGIVPAIVLTLVVLVGWFGGRTLFRVAESNFWSLNALAVEPVYLIGREGLRYFTEKLLPSGASEVQYARLRALAAALAGIAICALALVVLYFVWPHSRWVGTLDDLTSLNVAFPVAVANSVALIAAYVAAAALCWGIADASMTPPTTSEPIGTPAVGSRKWRVAHLSDIHAVGERYGFRIESGRSGPRGNERLKQVFARLAELHAEDPVHAVLITGDMTDAGRSAEWAELLEAIAPYPQLAKLVLMLPGNHDLNVADRANPARFELPTSPNRRLRQLRVLSILSTLQGNRVCVVDQPGKKLGSTLATSLEPHLAEITRFADSGRPRFSRALSELWNGVFPMIAPPDSEDGLGFILLNSNLDTQFSFTSALGLISADQVRSIDIATAQFPQAHWVVALHHHVVEYPRAGHALSERIGTALINGNWFLRRLGSVAKRIVVMHGHRHIDWVGECAGLAIVSAPSPVMGATDEHATEFYIHSLATGPDGRLRLLAPQKITLPGSPAETAD